MDVETLIAAMRDHPWCVQTMAALADYWMERDDARGEALNLLREVPPGPHPMVYGYNQGIARRWVDAAVEEWTKRGECCSSVVSDRLVFCAVYAAADHDTRRKYRGE